jgi:hypothetical protein
MIALTARISRTPLIAFEKGHRNRQISAQIFGHDIDRDPEHPVTIETKGVFSRQDGAMLVPPMKSTGCPP